MAYVRTRGNQLVIVQGERVPGTKNVQQRILATIYSRPEALAILGRSADPVATAHRFRRLLELDHPDVKLDWSKIDAAIAENLDVLPDDYAYETSRLRGRFREQLGGFAHQLAITDAQELATSAELIRSHRHELEFLSEMIEWRLKTCDAAPSEWTADDRFGWRFAARGHGRRVPGEVEEMASGYYERGEHERAAAVFRLLIDAFADYAEGHNYLGLIALARDDPGAAAKHFEDTVEVGRRLFPARIAKKHYWSDLDTRPYMRGLRNLALTYNQLGRFDDAERICARLHDECGDDITASYHRAEIALNRGRWLDAIEHASRLVNLYPDCNFVVAFAAFELGRPELPAFLHAAANFPRATRMLFSPRFRSNPDRSYDDIKDHNCGVSMRLNLHAYLARRGTRATTHFRRLVADPRVAELLDDVLATRAVRSTRGPEAEYRKAFDRLLELQSPRYTAALASRLGASSATPRSRRLRS